MTVGCARLVEVLRPDASAEALEHARTCPTCSSLAPTQQVLKPGLAAAARAELKASPTVRRWWWDGVVLLALDLALTAIALALLDVTQASRANQGVAAALLALMGLGTWAAIAPRGHALRYGVVALAGFAAVWMVAGGSGGAGFGGAGCALLEGAMSLLPLAAIAVITTRFAFDFWRALAGGLSVGVAGLFVLHLHCSNGSAAHLLAFHAVPWLVTALAAVALRRALPTRSFAN